MDMTTIQAVRKIQEAMRQTGNAAYLRAGGESVRIINARTRPKGIAFEAQSLSTGKWIAVNPSDHIEVMHDGRPVSIYVWEGPGHPVISAYFPLSLRREGG